MLSVQANTGPPWRRKAATAFWRGRDSRQERLDLVRMSLDRPAVIDARLTNMFFFKHDVTQHGEIVKHVSFFSFFEVGGRGVKVTGSRWRGRAGGVGGEGCGMRVSTSGLWIRGCGVRVLGSGHGVIQGCGVRVVGLGLCPRSS